MQIERANAPQGADTVMSDFTCNICGQEYAYSIANPIGVGAVSICKPHYDKLMQAQAIAWQELIESKGE
jgi:hypothetical protein